jgi:hypothetical protein
MIDLVDCCRSTYEKIPKHIKKSFLVIFFSSLIVFAFSIIHYFLGPEDWPEVVSQTGLFGWELSLGRYFTRFWHFFIFDGYAGLPIIGKLFALFMLSIASVMLGVYWRLPRNTISYLLIGLVVTLQPYIMGIFYFSVGIEFVLVLPFFLMLGLLLCEKAKDFRLWCKILLLVCSVLCFWFVFGGHPSLINTVVVIFVGRILIDFILTKDKKLLQLISSHKYAIVAVVVGLLLHFAVISWLRQKGIMVDGYNSSLIDISEWPARMWIVIRTALKYLSCYRISFFPDFFTWLWTFLLCLAGGSTVLDFIHEKCNYNKRVINIIIFVLLFSCALFGTLGTNIITTGTTFFVERSDFFGIAFFHALILAVLFNINRVIIKNVTFLCCIVLLWICIVQDFNIQKVLYFGFEAEKAQWMRIINRIETKPEFDADKSYRLLILGSTEAYRPYFYINRKNRVMKSPWLLTNSFMSPYGEDNHLSPLNHYSAYGFKGKWTQIPRKWGGQPARVLRLRFNQALESVKDELAKAEAWPALTSVQIKNDIILLVLDKKDLAEAKDLVNLN